MTPLVSVVVPAYNAGDFLQPAVRSVLDQTYENLEVILVDDGSTDGSVNKLKAEIADPRIRWFRQANAGKPMAMNFALKQVRGEYYALQDADDLSQPRRIAALVAALQQYPQCAAVFSGYELILDGYHMAPTYRTKDISQCCKDVERMAMPGHDPTAMYRVSMVRKFEYEPSLLQGEGHDYILRVGEEYPMLVLGECLYSYRVHWASLTRGDPERRQKFVWEVLRRACERRGIDFEEWRASRPKRRFRSRSSLRDNGLAAHFIKSVQDQRNRGQRLAALWTGLQCARLNPLDFQYLKAFIYSLSPDWLRARVGSYQS